jgi:hypothetical protein
MTFVEFFRQAYGKQSDKDFGPYDYHRVEEPWLDLLKVPTRMSKTASVQLECSRCGAKTGTCRPETLT